MADFRPSLDIIEAAFAVPATVTLASGEAIETSVIWDAYPPVVEDRGGVVDFDTEWVALRRDQIPDIQPNDIILAPRVEGATPLTFRVLRVDRSDSQLFYVAVE